MKKKVLIIPSRYPTVYQPHNYIFVEEQAKALSEYVDVIVMGGIPVSLKVFFKKGFKLFSRKKVIESNYSVELFLYPALPKQRKFNEFIRFFINKILVRNKLKQDHIDVVHFHSYSSASIGAWIKEKYNIPYIITEHSSQFYKTNLSTFEVASAIKAFSKSDLNIAVSTSLKEALKSTLGIGSTYLPNMVNTTFFRPTLPYVINESKTYLTIGNLVKVKNHELLIRSFSRFFSKNKNSLLQIIGDGQERGNLNRLIRELNMEDHIQLLGYKDQQAIKSFLENADYFVLSSKKETFGVVVIEALSMGLPVLLTNFGGVSDEISHFEGCILVENNEESLACGMEDIQCIKKNLNIREFALDNYSNNVICSKLLNIYEQI